MKLLGNTKVLIPWFDSEGQKNWSTITFHGDIDKRRIYREVRKFALHNFGKRVSKAWLRSVPLIVNKYDRQVEIKDEDYNKFLEEFIQRIQYNEDEDRADTTSTGSDPQGSEVPLCALPN